jgi:hypothetical protein
MTGCQGLLSVRSTVAGTLRVPFAAARGACLLLSPMEERPTREVERLRLFQEPTLTEEAYSLEQWLDLNA